MTPLVNLLRRPNGSLMTERVATTSLSSCTFAVAGVMFSSDPRFPNTPLQMVSVYPIKYNVKLQMARRGYFKSGYSDFKLPIAISNFTLDEIRKTHTICKGVFGKRGHLKTFHRTLHIHDVWCVILGAATDTRVIQIKTPDKIRLHENSHTTGAVTRFLSFQGQRLHYTICTRCTNRKFS